MYVVEHPNPFNLEETRQIPIEPGESLQDWVARTYAGRVDQLAYIYYDGQILRADSFPHYRAHPQLTPHAVCRPGDPFTILATALSVVSIAAVALIPDPPDVSDRDVSPTYNLAAQQNSARLGANVPIQYGRCRIWPDLIAQPYSTYNNNEQYVYQLFCLGAGEFSVGNLQIEDTDVTSFDEISYEYYYNQPVTLFPTDVETSVEVAEQVLSTSNTGPFSANSSGTTANRIEIDIVFPQGLHRARSSGDIDSQTVNVIAEYRAIPPGSWQTLVDTNVTRADRTPQRLTFGADVTPGRYEVRVRRGDAESSGPKLYNRCQWQAMRAYLEDDAITYDDVTVLAVRAKATGNLTELSRKRFNVVATRKLPIYSGSWSSPTATRALAWALADIVRAEYGADQVDARLDISALSTLNSTWSSAGDEFNYRFDTRVTLWEALKIAARAGRAYPVRNNNVISFVRDEATTTPTALFNRHNIVRDTFRVEYSLTGEDEHDAITAIYIDPDNDYKEKQVLCQPAGSSAANPKDLRYPGITDRDQAWRLGMYDAEAMIKRRKVARFETELEGLIPQKGDLITVANEDFNLTQGSELIYASGTTLRVAQDLEWTVTSPATTYAIRLRKPNGDVDGPKTVTQGATPNELILASGLSWTPNTDGEGQRTLVQFGQLAITNSDWLLNEIRPLGGNKVALAALNYVSSVYTVGVGSAPSEGAAAPIAANDDQPVIDYLLLENTTEPATLRVAWSPAAGADYYVVQFAVDASPLTWIQVRETTGTLVEFKVPVGTIYVRVAGIGKVRGVWKQDSIAAHSYSETSPTSLSAVASLVLASNGQYQTNIVFSFTEPGDDHLVEAYEAQYQLARHNGVWQPLYYSKETTHEFRTAEIGEHQFRVRSVYVPGHVYSDWAETQVITLGTFTSLTTIGLADPVDPTLFISADEDFKTAQIRVRVGYNDTASPEQALPEQFAIFYSAEPYPNALESTTDSGGKIYLDPQETTILGSFQLTVAPGSTTKNIRYTDPGGNIDFDLSGMWWVSVVPAAGSPSSGSRYFKVFESSSTEIILPPGDELTFTPQAGDTINVLELSWHDARLDEFKLAFANGEVIKHQGIDYDGDYYLDVDTRGAEGTSQGSQGNTTIHYFPAPGPGTNIVLIDAAEFQEVDGAFEYAGNIDLVVPAAFSWASVSCGFFRKASKDGPSAYVRSNIVPLVIGGPY